MDEVRPNWVARMLRSGAAQARPDVARRIIDGFSPPRCGGHEGIETEGGLLPGSPSDTSDLESN